MDTDYNPKKRGLEHLKHKKRHPRGRAVASTSTGSKPKSTPALESNWDRYEQDDDDADVKQLDSRTDFSILASAPITRSGHFQFKQDKQEMQDQDVKQFDLDLNMLVLSIAAVPFNVRSGIPDHYFSKNQMTIMEKMAADNADKYRLYLQKRKLVEEHGDSQKDVSVPAAEPLQSAEFENSEHTEEEKIDGNIQIEKCEEQEHSPHQHHQIDKSDDSDLEKWLDDVLDV